MTVMYNDGTTDSISVAASTNRTTLSTIKILNAQVPGTIVAATVDIQQGTVPTGPGQLYASGFLVRGSVLMAKLCSGYVYNEAAPSLTGPFQNTVDGPGRIYTAVGAVPAAGAEIADTVPSNARWRLISIEVDLVTSGAAANRTVNLFVDDAGAEVTRRLLLTDTTAQITALTRTHGWYPGTDSVTTASVSITDVGDASEVILAKFPQALAQGIMLTAGNKLRTVTGLIDVGDQYSAARYVVEEWIGVAQ